MVSRLSFRNKIITSARLCPDGNSFVFATEEGDLARLWMGHRGSPGARPLDVPSRTNILAISTKGEMALKLTDGTLAVAPLAGGVAPRQMAEGVEQAEWHPNGHEMAIVRLGQGGTRRVEYPIGQTLFESMPGEAFAIDCLRFSPDGSRLAFLERGGIDRQRLWLLDLKGERKLLASGELGSLAWLPGGKHLAATEVTQNHHLLSEISISGKKRTIYSSPWRIDIRDVAKDGSIFLQFSQREIQLFSQDENEQAHNLSWLQTSDLADQSLDGSGLLFAETNDGMGPSGVYFRKTDGSDAIRLGNGDPLLLSPDGKWALVYSLDEHGRLVLVPTGPGQSTPLPNHGFRLLWGAFMGSHEKLLVGASKKDAPFRYYIQDTRDGSMTPWGPSAGSPEAFALPDPKGERIALGPVGQQVHIHDQSGRLIKALPAFSDTRPIQWSQDGRFIFIAEMKRFEADIWRMEIETGKRQIWKTIQPQQQPGDKLIRNVSITPDGRRSAYSVSGLVGSDLFWMAFK